MYKVIINETTYNIDADNMNEAVQIAVNEHYEMTGELVYTDTPGILVTDCDNEEKTYQWDDYEEEWVETEYGFEL